MGGMQSLMEKMPGAGKMTDAMKSQMNAKEMAHMIAIINSMTPQERRFPAILKGSRKKRVAAGSGLQVQDVNRLLKQHAQMSKMMKWASIMGMNKMLRGMQGKMPPGMGF